LKFYTIDPDDYMDMMERQFDCDLKAPEFQGDHFGIQTKRHGLYSDRDIMAMDVAIKIKERYWNRKNVRIADLGGGVGYLAYWLTKLGFDDITYVDLPTVTTSAMYFLGTNGIDNVKFITPEEFEGDFDVVINVDGMTQYSKESAQKYMRKIEENAKHFMSVNREFDDFRVSEICDMRRISRSPSWVRRGYVEEDYVPENT
jgi:2-polyprenyl-3-methyl-5-hydroxy-6-metoxy-1,4-benzoquinol methylase